MQQNNRFNLLLILLTGLSFLTASLDSRGDLIFVSNNGGNFIEEFTQDGVGSVFATANLAGPTGLAFNSAGDLFVANNGTGTLEEFNPDGSFKTTLSTDLHNPRGMVFDNAGNLYVANQSSGTIDKFTPNGTESVFVTGLDFPNGLALAVDQSNNLYVTNSGAVNIYKVTPGGGVTPFTTINGSFNGMAFDANGNLYAINNGDEIDKFSLDGTQSSVFANTGLSVAKDITFDSSGNLYATNQGTGTVEVFNSSGQGTVFASNLNGPCFVTILAPEPNPATLIILGLGLLVTARGIQKRFFC